jgi:DNA-binding response OmpR family regulator
MTHERRVQEPVVSSAPGPAPDIVLAIAEDDDELRFLLCDAFHKRGWRVVEIEDTSELDDYFEFVERHGAPRGLPDAVLTDLRMPGGSGLDALSRARAKGVVCPFVVLSAYPDWEVEKRVLALGNAVLISKPAKLNDVAELLIKIIAEVRGTK